MRAHIPWPQLEARTMWIARGGVLDWPACREVDARGPCHLGDLLGRDQFPVVAVDHVEKAVFRSLHQDLAELARDLDLAEMHVHRGIIVPALARIDLIVPLIGAGLAVQCDDR